MEPITVALSLQKAQNYASRITIRAQNVIIYPLLWLGCIVCLKYSALITIFYCIFTNCWMVWSASKHCHDIPCTSSKTYADWAFMSAAPRLWRISGVPNPLRFSRPTSRRPFICKPFTDELTCSLLELSLCYFLDNLLLCCISVNVTFCPFCPAPWALLTRKICVYNFPFIITMA